MILVTFKGIAYNQLVISNCVKEKLYEIFIFSTRFFILPPFPAAQRHRYYLLTYSPMLSCCYAPMLLWFPVWIPCTLPGYRVPPGLYHSPTAPG